MPLILLHISHVQQRNPSDCLVACAQMALGYLGQPTDYNDISRKLATRWFGTAMSNITRLSAFGVKVKLNDLSVEEILNCLRQDQVVIAAVDTADLSYWSDSVFHAVVVVGMSEDVVHLNDPALVDAPQVISLREFELSLLAYDHLCAVISR